MEVVPYVQRVMQCFRCLRFGHSLKFCRGKQRCVNYRKEHEGECTSETECVHCKRSHKATDRRCASFIRQQKIKQLVVYEDLSYKEAERICDNPSFASISQRNRFSLLEDGDEFPMLPTTAKRYDDDQRKSNTTKFPVVVSRKRQKLASPCTLDKPYLFTAPQLNLKEQCVLQYDKYSENIKIRKDNIIDSLDKLMLSLIKNLIPSQNLNLENLRIKDAITNIVNNTFKGESNSNASSNSNSNKILNFENGTVGTYYNGTVGPL